MALPITLPDGRQVIPPDDLSEEELELFKTDFATKFPIPMPEEDIADTPLSTDQIPSSSPSPEEIATLPPRLRLPHEYKEGDPFLEQVKAGASSTLLGMQTTFGGELGIENLADLKTELDEAEDKLRNDFVATQQKERDFVQEINKKYGDGNLDLNTGVFTPRPAEETTDKTL